ncbi:sigma-70 family RNA polymerase sigma factor [Streptomyces sp. NPDC090127]|uniref:sigma-70 family RNA polymerase sigma factor n=1 Tax=Streptomyces sp. NPDC090127 TaxID=3365953 RepID=UPI00380BB763
MHSDERGTAALVDAAVSGDPHAGERLVRAYLPLVYNIVGRALDGHADVDDVVQETMVRALDGLPGLREPARFRSWLVAIAMNQIRRRWRERQAGPVPGLDRAAELADPAGDFVDLTILRLGLSGQRREVAEATRWLDESDREVLALWWLETGGELDRAELAEALAVTPAHAAVRVQRMKERLETGRTVVRALGARHRCEELSRLTDDWDGRPSPLWRKRLARHTTSCSRCLPPRTDLAPAEALLVGLGLVPPLLLWAAARPETQAAAWAADAPDQAASSGWTPGDADGTDALAHGGGTSEPLPDPGPVPAAPESGATPADLGVGGPPADLGAGGAPADPGAGGVPADPGMGAVPADLGAGAGGGGGAGAAGGGVLGRAWIAGAVAVGVLGGLILLVPSEPEPREPAPAAPVAAPPARTTAPRPSPTTPSPTPPPTRPPSPTATPTPQRTATAEERLTRLVNQRRAEAGCAPLRTDPRLTGAARAYARDMARRGYYAHSSPEGRFADERISAAGYEWSAWAENLARGSADPASVFDDWMDGSMHESNMLNCGYRDTGVAAVPGPDGTLWVQKLAAPAR